MDENRSKYWRSLDELAATPEFRAFVEREFPQGVPDGLEGPSRRQFLKIMAASFGLAGLTACRWPQETIVPYARPVEGRIPGVPVQYATAMELGGVAAGLLVTSYDGRPIKIEGNPLHPYNRGATDAITQATVLDLYDPDRSRTPVLRQAGQELPQDWAGFEQFVSGHFPKLAREQGEGLCILSEASSSLSLADMRRRLLASFPRARWFEYEPIDRDNERAGTALAFGRPCRVHLALDRAEVIVALQADILGSHPAALRYARDFIRTRATADEGRMSRLYVVESTFTLTGAMADHRLPLAGFKTWPLVAAMEATLDGREATADLEPAVLEFLSAAVADLREHMGRSVVVAGPGAPPEVHALVCAINAALGNAGKTVAYTAEPDAERPSYVEAIRSLTEAMGQGQVRTLVILGGNPVYDAPADVGFAEGLSKVPTSIHLSLYDDETSRACTWHVPRAHYLESWGDARAYDGTICTVQPLIEPLYGGRTPVELLALLINDEQRSGYEIVRRALRDRLGSQDFETAWKRLLHDGVLAGSEFPREVPSPVAAGLEKARQTLRSTPAAGREATELVFLPSPSVYDGRFANNGWLQELPHPMTRITWDNAALVSPRFAERLGCQTGDVISIVAGGATVEAAAFVLPGQADDSIGLAVGYGRKAAGRVGTGVGFNAYPLRTTAAMHAAPVRVAVTGRSYRLATTQDHHMIDTVGARERARRIGGPGEVGEIYREATLEHYRRHPHFVRDGHPGAGAHHTAAAPRADRGPTGTTAPALSAQLWEEPGEPGGHRWAMAIDLNRCIGCSACVVACQAENNIPIVGKDEVARGREMHWIRVDRYFRGAPESPQSVHQPVPCMQCENAPCEQVCPVAASVHDAEGLNVQVYNRCVGTRYCSNNCPYKVRRFNFFNLTGDVPRTTQMVFNPEVTVRSRGVMEKCTYCTQRIQAVKIRARNERRPIADGEIVPACAQACPTEAIVFGDLNDPDSKVARLHAHRRAYAMLEELNVRPRTLYLAKVRNERSPERYVPGGDGSAGG